VRGTWLSYPQGNKKIKEPLMKIPGGQNISQQQRMERKGGKISKTDIQFALKKSQTTRGRKIVRALKAPREIEKGGESILTQGSSLGWTVGRRSRLEKNFFFLRWLTTFKSATKV